MLSIVRTHATGLRRPRTGTCPAQAAIRSGAADALSHLASGLVAHPDNSELRKQLESGKLTTAALQRQVASLIHRMVLLGMANARGMLPHTGRQGAAERLRQLCLTPRTQSISADDGGAKRQTLYRELIEWSLQFAALFVGGATCGDDGFWSGRAISDVGGCQLDDASMLKALGAMRLAADGSAAAVDLAGVRPETLGDVHEVLLCHELEVDARSRTAQMVRKIDNNRRASGSFYTPDCLIQALLEHALAPIIRRQKAEQRDAGGVREALLSIRILDPTCGAGHCLLPAARRLASELAPLGHRACADLFCNCIHGIDIDPVAVELCKAALWLECGQPDLPLSSWDHNIRCGDSLMPAACDGPFAQHAELFDLVIGNPPFANVIEGSVPAEVRSTIRERFPLLGGTADYSFAFLALAATRVKPGGRVAMVMPRNVLNAPAIRRWKSSLPARLRPNMLFATDRADHFAGAAVFVSLVVLGPNDICSVAIGPDPGMASWRQTQVTGTNWWSHLAASQEAQAADGPARCARVGEAFEVAASMATGDAYNLLPFVYDAADGTGQKLVTTGLIGVGECHWGQSRCRYLKHRFQFPRINDRAGALTTSLLRRLERSRRPKVIVAGLSKRIECFVDARGEYAGAVSTYSIHHPADDIDALRAVAEVLLREESSERFRIELGGNAMGGGNTTMTREFLERLAWR